MLKVSPLEGTYLCWVDARGLGLSDGDRAALLRDKARVWLSDGGQYGENGRGFWRVNLACPRAVLVQALERIRAKAGMDIGDTLIGMHLKEVAVPVRLGVKKIGQANLVCARTRPRFIGGERARYQEELK